MTDAFRFAGFSGPRYTQVPDELFDELLPLLSEAELKVLLYIIRRTFGFKKDADTISIRQMVSGITTREGRILDRGTGLSEASVIRAVRGLVAKGIVVAQRNASRERGDLPTTYALAMRDDTPSITVIDGGPPQMKDPRPSPRGTQETVLQETDRQETDPSKIRGARTWTKTIDPEARTALVDYLQDYARELNDGAQLSSSLTRAVRLYRESGLSLDDFVARMQEARRVTQEATARIANRDGAGRKSKMAYWFKVLEGLA